MFLYIFYEKFWRKIFKFDPKPWFKMVLCHMKSCHLYCLRCYKRTIRELGREFLRQKIFFFLFFYTEFLTINCRSPPQLTTHIYLYTLSICLRVNIHTTRGCLRVYIHSTRWCRQESGVKGFWNVLVRWIKEVTWWVVAHFRQFSVIKFFFFFFFFFIR